jgi:hypothetical protein
MLGEGCSEGFLGQIDEPVTIGRQIGRLRLGTVEDIGAVSPSSSARAATQMSAFTFSSRVAAVTAPA